VAEDEVGNQMTATADVEHRRLAPGALALSPAAELARDRFLETRVELGRRGHARPQPVRGGEREGERPPAATPTTSARPT
jgi:hypothetical protein